MKDKMKIVLIGAGSKQFSRGLIHDLVLEKELNSLLKVNVIFVDVNKKNLNNTLNYAKECVDLMGSSITFSATTDRKKALPGADFILLLVAINRMELWEQDFRIPLAFGMPHIYGENGGPGALFHALRNFNIIIPICRDIEKYCPNALLINFSNPESRILTAILTLSKVKAIGLCHGFYSFYALVSKVLNRPVSELDIRTAGMNHFFTYYKISERRSGKDLKSNFEKRLSQRPEILPPLTRYFWETFNIIGIYSDTHLGEYVGFAHEFTGLRWKFGIENRKVLKTDERVTLEMVYELWEHGGAKRNYLEMSEGKPDADKEEKLTHKNKILGSGELAIPIIADILLDRKELRPTVNILNTEGYIENLARDGCVEIPAVVGSSGIRPEFVGALPEGFAAQIRLQHSIQKLLVQAYKEKSKALLLQALLLDPVVNSAKNASRLLDHMLDIQSEYLPEIV